VLTAADALGVAGEVAATLAADVVEREATGRSPVREVELLREAGLLPLLIPAERGGCGAAPTRARSSRSPWTPTRTVCGTGTTGTPSASASRPRAR
jgi:alkylation response protein AidB-like acyl-CoA dehydrogenase